MSGLAYIRPGTLCDISAMPASRAGISSPVLPARPAATPLSWTMALRARAKTSPRGRLLRYGVTATDAFTPPRTRPTESGSRRSGPAKSPRQVRRKGGAVDEIT